MECSDRQVDVVVKSQTGVHDISLAFSEKFFVRSLMIQLQMGSINLKNLDFQQTLMMQTCSSSEGDRV